MLTNNLSSIPEPVHKWKERADSSKLFSAMDYMYDRKAERGLFGGRKRISSNICPSVILIFKKSASGAGEMTSVVRAHCSYRPEFSSQHPHRQLSTTCNGSLWDVTPSGLYRHWHTATPTHHTDKELIISYQQQYPTKFIIYPKPTNTCISHII